VSSIEQRRKWLNELGVNEVAPKAEVNMVLGIACFDLPGIFSYDRTRHMTSVGPEVYVDVDEGGMPIGLEDISADMARLVDKWLKALVRAKRQAERKKKGKKK